MTIAKLIALKQLYRDLSRYDYIYLQHASQLNRFIKKIRTAIKRNNSINKSSGPSS